MRLYVHMIMCGSICTLMYILFNTVLSYEMPLKWKRWLLRTNITFYLLPVPWLAAELKGVVRMLLEVVAGVSFPKNHDIKEINAFNGTDLWKSMLVFDAEGKLVYITGYEKYIPAIRTVLTVCIIALITWIALYIRISLQCKSKMVFLDSTHHYIEDQGTVCGLSWISGCTGGSAPSRIKPCVLRGCHRKIFLLWRYCSTYL